MKVESPGNSFEVDVDTEPHIIKSPNGCFTTKTQIDPRMSINNYSWLWNVNCTIFKNHSDANGTLTKLRIQYGHIKFGLVDFWDKVKIEKIDLFVIKETFADGSVLFYKQCPVQGWGWSCVPTIYQNKEKAGEILKIIRPSLNGLKIEVVPLIEKKVIPLAETKKEVVVKKKISQEEWIKKSIAATVKSSPSLFNYNDFTSNNQEEYEEYLQSFKYVIKNPLADLYYVEKSKTPFRWDWVLIEFATIFDGVVAASVPCKILKNIGINGVVTNYEIPSKDRYVIRYESNWYISNLGIGVDETSNLSEAIIFQSKEDALKAIENIGFIRWSFGNTYAFDYKYDVISLKEIKNEIKN